MSEQTTKDAVAAAFDKAAAASAGPSEPAASAPAEPREAPEPKAPAEPKPAAEGRARAPDGKFAPAGKPAPVAAAKPAPEAAPAAPVAPPAPDLKPPADWKPLAREKWGALPREVQEEALRLHVEAKKLLQDTTEARKAHEQFRQWQAALQPYGPILGADPMKGTLGVLQTAHALSVAPPAQKAAIIAHLIRGYDVPIEALAGALNDPQAVQTQAPAQQPISEQAIVERVRQEMRAEQARSEAQAWAAKGHEFLADVQGNMIRLMHAGLASDFDEAYNKACQMDPQIAAILRQREEAKAANAQAASMQAQAAATASVRSEPAGPIGAGKAASTRDEVARQFDRLSRARV